MFFLYILCTARKVYGPVNPLTNSKSSDRIVCTLDYSTEEMKNYGLHSDESPFMAMFESVSK